MTLPSNISSLFTFEYFKQQKTMMRGTEYCKKVLKTATSASTGLSLRNQGIWKFIGEFTETRVHWHGLWIALAFSVQKILRMSQERECFPSASGNSQKQ